MKYNYFKIFTNCIFITGAKRALVMDIQRNIFQTVPLSMIEILKLFEQKMNIEEVKNLYGEENKNTIDEYISFLIENDFGFYVDYELFDLFVEMDFLYEIPSKISNAVIEISSNNIDYFEYILSQISNFNCNALQLVCYDFISIDSLKIILKKSNKFEFNSISLVLKYSDDLLSCIEEIDFLNYSVTNILIHSCSDRISLDKKTSFYIEFTNKKITSINCCGAVKMKYFNINQSKVLESLNHNSCLNRKLSIDKDGYICNCPAMSQRFGNIKDTSLEEALNHPDFKKYWNVTKDMIQVCKDCEFRHICTDCRAYTERTHFEGDIDLSQPLKCGYNPYTNEWAEWSTNPLKQKAIEFYGMQDLIKKDA